MPEYQLVEKNTNIAKRNFFDFVSFRSGLTFAFGTGHQYYEVEFDFREQIFKKVTNNGYQRLVNEFLIEKESKLDYDFFNSVGDLILILRNRKWMKKKI